MPLPAHSDTRVELLSGAWFSFDARDRSLTTRTGHALTHSRASGSVITDSDGVAIAIAHSAVPWSMHGGAVGLRVDPAAGSALLPAGDPIVGRQADVLIGAIGSRIPGNGSGLVRCHRAWWMDEVGTLPAAYLLGLGGANPRLAVYCLAATRTVRVALLDGSGNEVGAEAAIPAGDVLAIAWQWRNLTTGGSVRVDVGSGFGAWSSAVAGAIPTLGSTALQLGDAAHATGQRAATGLCKVHLTAGSLTRDQLLESV